MEQNQYNQYQQNYYNNNNNYNNQNFASFGKRFLAYFIDYALYFFIAFPVMFISILLFEDLGSLLGLGFAFFILFVLKILIPLKNGQTIGKKIAGIRIIQENSGMTPTFAQILIREIVFYFLGIIDVIFYFSGQKCLHDRITNTIVVTI